MSTNPECFGVFWEGTSSECKKCRVNPACLLRFQEDVLLPELQKDSSISDEDLGEALGGIDPVAIALAREGLSVGEGKSKKVKPKRTPSPVDVGEGGEEEEEAEEAAPPPPLQKSKKNLATVVEGKPPKKRGRRAAGAVECEACEGTGVVGDESCPVCGGKGWLVPTGGVAKEEKKEEKKSGGLDKLGAAINKVKKGKSVVVAEKTKMIEEPFFPEDNELVPEIGGTLKEANVELVPEKRQVVITYQF